MNATLFSNPIIQSLLDLDVYKINMMQAAFTLYPETQVRYELIVRSNEDLSHLESDVAIELEKLANLSFSTSDLQYLTQAAPYLTQDFIGYLSQFQLKPTQQTKVYTKVNSDGTRQLAVEVNGIWHQVILYETLIMSIVSELRNRTLWASIPEEQVIQVLNNKIDYLEQQIGEHKLTGFKFSEMGTRRRFSAKVQERVLTTLSEKIPQHLIGTSNYHLAKKHQLFAVGTVAHEWFMAHQVLYPLPKFQKVALTQWLKHFNNQLGIALTDTIGIEAFLEDFDLPLATAYAGVRHDSGCPFYWGEKMIEHYQSLGIDPLEKTLVFTDGLNFATAIDIAKRFNGRVQISFGIGTFLANDMGGWENSQGQQYKALSMVVKMTECNGSAVAKISDEPEKAMCKDAHFLSRLKQEYGLAA